MPNKRSSRSWVRSGASAGAAAAEPPPARARWKWLALTGALVGIAAIVVVGVWIAIALPGESEPEGPPRAVIIDQLSLTFPNADFKKDATSTLRDAGYTVDYVAGDDVTVDFYRHLPEQRYDVLVVRSHSARIQGEFRGEQLDETVIFSNEPYDEEAYLDEQIDARLDVAYTHETAPRYFGITASFIDDSMRGDFGDATVIMMGCEGIASERTAQAFVDKGADSYVSWDNTVSATHTDEATARLLQFMFDDGLSTKEAVAQTMAEIGPDPAYSSVLRAYNGEG